MNEEHITAVADVPAKCNPLGAAAQDVPDPDGHRVEAADILFGFKLRGRSVRADEFVARILNDAFDLGLDAKTRSPQAKEMVAILQKKRF